MNSCNHFFSELCIHHCLVPPTPGLSKNNGVRQQFAKLKYTPHGSFDYIPLWDLLILEIGINLIFV